MKVNIQVRQGVLIVRPQGEIDVKTAAQFREEVEEGLLVSGVKDVLLNLKDVSFIDSSGLGVILGRYKYIHQRGGSMLAVELKPPVKRIFAMSGLLTLIRLYRTEAEALENF